MTLDLPGPVGFVLGGGGFGAGQVGVQRVLAVHDLCRVTAGPPS
ncbi:hypothetical protein [Umezawaea tangerina]|uniref:Uncharacterized protein n=1 Tax=Umezawaea tangerina TaxID=84725 RepID=A0A2T0T4V2_9PSEU|nr:hypothetical protein [Umezawaea tangerina]PRY40700.1 hypothetical protein CLV43_106441 [Umezawaea tangerina]